MYENNNINTNEFASTVAGGDPYVKISCTVTASLTNAPAAEVVFRVF